MLKIAIFKIWIWANIFFDPLYCSWIHINETDDVNIEI
jgi:hypothetical protein